MRLVRQQAAPTHIEKSPEAKTPWKVLVVDDEEDIHSITRLNLKNMIFVGRGVELTCVSSAEQAKAVLNNETDFAVALIDVVMETDTAGLDLVEYIRDKLRNYHIRLIIRTGQPGVAPERHVIDCYDIDDYKDKTELTAQKLYTTIRTALKAYKDIKIIEQNRHGLEYILIAAPSLYLPYVHSLDDFFRGVLTQITTLCQLGKNALLSSINSLVGIVEDKGIQVRAGTGVFSDNNEHTQTMLKVCAEAVLQQKDAQQAGLPAYSLLLPLHDGNHPVGFIFLENVSELSADNRYLLRVLVQQCTSALTNLRLHLNLQEIKRQSIYMLAVAAEFKDHQTGAHISRMGESIYRLALEMGLEQDIAETYKEVGMLHDIGKLGIPDRILRKPARLNHEEQKIMRRHSEIGACILERHSGFALAREIALSHHEYWDGSGYPNGLKGEAIPLAARITAVADVFDALSHVRPYKNAWALEECVTEIREKSGSQFDPQVVDTFLRLVEKGQLPLENHFEALHLIPEELLFV